MTHLQPSSDHGDEINGSNDDRFDRQVTRSAEVLRRTETILPTGGIDITSPGS